MSYKDKFKEVGFDQHDLPYLPVRRNNPIDLGLRNRLLISLERATKERRNRQNLLPVPAYANYREEPAWVLYERELMLRLVNEERVKAGKAPISIEDVFKAEQQAFGRADYTSKFALYCTELVQEP